MKKAIRSGVISLAGEKSRCYILSTSEAVLDVNDFKNLCHMEESDLQEAVQALSLGRFVEEVKIKIPGDKRNGKVVRIIEAYAAQTIITWFALRYMKHHAVLN
jgi:hypothetical protein